MSVEDPAAVAVASQKGAQGKSTTTKNVARELAERGHRVLVADTDDNGHLTQDLGFADHYWTPDNDEGDRKDNPDLGLAVSGKVAPSEACFETGYGFDIAPSTDSWGETESNIENELYPSKALKTQFTDPLLGDVYDYILIDTSANRTTITNNAIVASLNLLVPIEPKAGEAGFRQIYERIFKDVKEKGGDIQILALVPNQLSSSIMNRTADRILLEKINDREGIAKYVPNFARITPEMFDKIDSRDLHLKPGIRENKAIGQDPPLRDVDSENPNLEYYQELAKIVENKGVVRADRFDVSKESPGEDGKVSEEVNAR